jgi:hypothetical protein
MFCWTKERTRQPPPTNLETIVKFQAFERARGCAFIWLACKHLTILHSNFTTTILQCNITIANLQFTSANLQTLLAQPQDKCLLLLLLKYPNFDNFFLYILVLTKMDWATFERFFHKPAIRMSCVCVFTTEQHEKRFQICGQFFKSSLGANFDVKVSPRGWSRPFCVKLLRSPLRCFKDCSCSSLVLSKGFSPRVNVVLRGQSSPLGANLRWKEMLVNATGSKKDEVWWLNAFIFSVHSSLAQALSTMYMFG